jgi:predicted anti-sigma-YlaC factor YlaD
VIGGIEMKLWYWFLLAIIILGLTLVLIGYQYPSIGGDRQQGFTVMTFGSIALAFALALSVIYFVRWRRFWISSRV